MLIFSDGKWQFDANGNLKQYVNSASWPEHNGDISGTDGNLPLDFEILHLNRVPAVLHPHEKHSKASKTGLQHVLKNLGFY